MKLFIPSFVAALIVASSTAVNTQEPDGTTSTTFSTATATAHASASAWRTDHTGATTFANTESHGFATATDTSGGSAVAVADAVATASIDEDGIPFAAGEGRGFASTSGNGSAFAAGDSVSNTGTIIGDGPASTNLPGSSDTLVSTSSPAPPQAATPDRNQTRSSPQHPVAPTDTTEGNGAHRSVGNATSIECTKANNCRKEEVTVTFTPHRTSPSPQQQKQQPRDSKSHPEPSTSANQNTSSIASPRAPAMQPGRSTSEQPNHPRQSANTTGSTKTSGQGTPAVRRACKKKCRGC